MRTRLRGKATLLFMMLGLLLAIPAVALAADVINADLIDYTSQNANYTAGSANGVVTEYWVQADTDGCDPGDGGAVSFKLSVKSQSDGADVTASSFKARLDTDAAGSEQALNNFTLTLNGCAPKPPGTDQFPTTGVFKKVVFTSDANLAAGQYKVEINGSTISDPNDPANEYSPDNQNSFLINVSAPTTGGGGGTGGDPCAGVTVAAPTFANTTPTNGKNGWFNEDDGIPTVSATSTGNTVTYATDAAGPFGAAAPTLGQGETTVYAKATDGNNCSSTVASQLYKVDTVDPSVTPEDVINTTWRNTPLSQQFNATDDTSGLANPADGTFTLTASAESQEDANTPTVDSKTVEDVAGNSTTRKVSALIDLTKPNLGIVDNNAASYNVCGSARPTRPTFNPSDALSVLDGSEGDTWTDNVLATGVGTYKYSAHAKDKAGNEDFYPGPAATDVKTYSVVYGDAANGGVFSGFLPPINANGTRSVFKLTSTIPVKFQLTCNGAPLSNAVAYLTVQKVDPNPDGTVNEAIATDAATTGNQFRYADGGYHFNLSTKSGYTNPSGQNVSFSAGTWQLTVSLDDNTKRTIQIDLRK